MSSCFAIVDLFQLFVFSGTYGLWIDGDLYHGRTSSSKTFNNEPLTSHEDFIVASIEVWTFID